MSKYNSHTLANKDLQEAILDLHDQGLYVNAITEKLNLGLTPQAVRGFLKKEGITPHKQPRKKVDRSRPCQACGKTFTPKYNDGNSGKYKSCSKPCSNELIRRSKLKYTNTDIDSVIKLKKENITIKSIADITGVNINKVKDITKDNDLKLTPEQRQKNAYSAKIKKNPNAMVEMRQSYKDKQAKKYESKEFLDKLRLKLLELNYEYISGFTCPSKPFTIKCLKCKREREVSALYTIRPTSCKYCSSIGNSKGESNVRDWVESFGLYTEKFRFPNRGKELDIYVPELNFAIEYCGLYWHSERNNRNRTYHYDKMKAAEAAGIRLFTLFADEWRDRNSQVKSFLKSILNQNKRKLFARKCTIQEVDKITANKFLEDYHIQGKTVTTCRLGLFHQDELVGLLTGSPHHRQNQEGLFVLNRLVFKTDVSIAGGSSKLLKKFLQVARDEGYYKVISWSDNRISQGNVYAKTGWEKTQELAPDYSYVVGEGRQSKQSNKKKNLTLELFKEGVITEAQRPEYHTNHTEKELALILDKFRIYDCGKIRWEIPLD